MYESVAETASFSLSQNISPNMKLWGVVIEVNQKDIIVSLPGGMRGFVRTEEVSDIALHGNTKVFYIFHQVVN
jgi:ribosomal protein S1